MTKEDLRAYRVLAQELRQLRDQADAARRLCESTPERADLSGSLLQLEQQYDNGLQRLTERMGRIEDAVQRLDAPEERVLLRYRYLQGLSWPEIEWKMHYSERQVHRIHSRALQHIGRPE